MKASVLVPISGTPELLTPGQREKIAVEARHALDQLAAERGRHVVGELTPMQFVPYGQATGFDVPTDQMAATFSVETEAD